MTVTVTKSAFNLRDTLNSLKQKIGAKGSELLRADTITDAYNALNPVMFRNKVINGNFDVWQRGTSFTSGNTWTADRWRTYALVSGSTITQQAFAVGEAPFPGAGAYYLRFTPSVDSVNASDRYVSTTIEDWRQFDNKTVTISFWYRNTATLAGQGIQLRFKRTSSIYDSYGDISLPGLDITSNWKYYTATVKCPSLSGQSYTSSSYVEFGLYHQKVLATGNVDFAAVQIEEGNVATPFERRPYGLELALCQRYCFAQISTGGYYSFGVSSGNSTTPVANITFPVKMRTAPSVSASAGSTFLFGSGSANSIVLDQTSETNAWIYASGGTGSTGGYSGRFLANNTASAYLIWTAELS